MLKVKGRICGESAPLADMRHSLYKYVIPSLVQNVEFSFYPTTKIRKALGPSERSLDPEISR
jgi:hypothetical protein